MILLLWSKPVRNATDRQKSIEWLHRPKEFERCKSSSVLRAVADHRWSMLRPLRRAPAFDGAEGFGAVSKGGTGGSVLLLGQHVGG